MALDLQVAISREIADLRMCLGPVKVRTGEPYSGLMYSTQVQVHRACSQVQQYKYTGLVQPLTSQCHSADHILPAHLVDVHTCST